MASFPPPSGAGSIEYLYHIVSGLPRNSAVIHTANFYPLKAREFDLAFPQRIIRSNFIIHVLKRCYTGKNWLRLLRRHLISLREYILWPLFGFWLIIQERPDVVCIGEQNYAAVAAWIAYYLLGIPYIYFTYGEEIVMLDKYSTPIRRIIQLPILRRAKKVIVICEYIRELLVEMGVESNKIVKIIPAVGNQKKCVITPVQIAAVKKKYNTINRHVLLTIGSLTKRKGHLTVLDALPLIKSKFPEVIYIIAGGGPLESILRQRVIDLGLEKEVVFAGRVDDGELTCLYEICDVFVMPSRQDPETLDTEAFGMVFIEASAHGKPVIGGKAGGVEEAIQDGRTGFIIDGNDKILLVHKICDLLSNPEIAIQMGKAGQEHTLALTPDNNVEQFWQICQEIKKNKA